MSYGVPTGVISGIGIGAGGGSKPEALRTEYAEDGSYDGSYHGDIVFYLKRAGGEDGDGLEDGINEGQSDIGFGDYPEGNFTGNDVGSYPDQSFTNQLGAGSSAGDLDFNTAGSAGGVPDFGTEVIPGSFSANACRKDDLIESVRNAFQSVPTFDDAYVRLSEASSEFLFSELLDKSFNPEEERDILGTFERGSRADLAVQLARVSGGVTSTRDLVQGINNGTIGLSTNGFKATTKLLSGNTGRTLRSLR